MWLPDRSTELHHLSSGSTTVNANPQPTKRGAFNAVSASLQQFAGGVSAAVAGWLIVQRPNGSLAHFDWLGYVVMAITLVTFAVMYRVHKQVPEAAPR